METPEGTLTNNLYRANPIQLAGKSSSNHRSRTVLHMAMKRIESNAPSEKKELYKYLVVF
jgi:hypothetical protein